MLQHKLTLAGTKLESFHASSKQDGGRKNLAAAISQSRYPSIVFSSTRWWGKVDKQVCSSTCQTMARAVKRTIFIAILFLACSSPEKENRKERNTQVGEMTIRRRQNTRVRFVHTECCTIIERVTSKSVCIYRVIAKRTVRRFRMNTLIPIYNRWSSMIGALDRWLTHTIEWRWWQLWHILWRPWHEMPMPKKRIVCRRWTA